MLETDTILALAGIAVVDTQGAIDVHGFWRDVLEKRSSEMFCPLVLRVSELLQGRH